MSLPGELPPNRSIPPSGAPRKDVLFLVVLISLFVLLVVLWFADPDHRHGGRSRVGWPESKPAKP